MSLATADAARGWLLAPYDAEDAAKDWVGLGTLRRATVAGWSPGGRWPIDDNSALKPTKLSNTLVDRS